MLISAWLPVWVINFIDSGEVVGTFVVANRFAMGVTLALLAVEASAAPRFSALNGIKAKSELMRNLTRSKNMAFSMSVVLGGVLFLLLPTLANFVNVSQTNTFVLISSILILGYIVNAYFAPIGTFLQMTFNEKHALNIYIMGIITSVPVLILLMNSFAEVGLAVGCCLMYLFRGILLARKHRLTCKV